MADDRVDAILFAPGWDPPGQEGPTRLLRQMYYFERLSGAERAHVYTPTPSQPKVFLSRSATDTIDFPDGHPRARQPRYRWRPSPDGCLLGTLAEDTV